MATDTNNMTFWDHLDALRTAIIKSVAVALVAGVVAFCFKEQLFAIILAPQHDGFITYRLLDLVTQWVGGEPLPPITVQLISTGLAEQFMIHMQTAFCTGLIVASPYIVYQLFRFVSPALYQHERRYVVRVVVGGYALFAIGVAVCYFLIFPLTFRFLGDYQVSVSVDNLITLRSYVSAMLTMMLSIGVVFEIPILSWMFAKLGLLSAHFMRHYRRHAIVIILVVAAIITPTSDVFTLSLVALPMWLLYEVSIVIVSRTCHTASSNSNLHD